MGLPQRGQWLGGVLLATALPPSDLPRSKASASMFPAIGLSPCVFPRLSLCLAACLELAPIVRRIL